MAYDVKTGERLRKAVAGTKGLTESRMFGGLTFLVNGNMCCGVANDDLMIRVSHERSDEIVKRKHARACDFTGRPMRGIVLVSPAGFPTAARLERWVGEAIDYASTLPKKAKKAKKAPRARKLDAAEEVGAARRQPATRAKPTRTSAKAAASKGAARPRGAGKPATRKGARR